MGDYGNLRPIFDQKGDYRIILVIEMFTSFVKFELETLLGEFTVETTAFKC